MSNTKDKLIHLLEASCKDINFRCRIGNNMSLDVRHIDEKHYKNAIDYRWNGYIVEFNKTPPLTLMKAIFNFYDKVDRLFVTEKVITGHSWWTPVMTDVHISLPNHTAVEAKEAELKADPINLDVVCYKHGVIRGDEYSSGDKKTPANFSVKDNLRQHDQVHYRRISYFIAFGDLVAEITEDEFNKYEVQIKDAGNAKKIYELEERIREVEEGTAFNRNDEQVESDIEVPRDYSPTSYKTGYMAGYREARRKLNQDRAGK